MSTKGSWEGICDSDLPREGSVSDLVVADRWSGQSARGSCQICPVRASSAKMRNCCLESWTGRRITPFKQC